MTIRELRKILKDFKDPDIEVMVWSVGFGKKEITKVSTEYMKYGDGVEYKTVVIHGG